MRGVKIRDQELGRADEVEVIEGVLSHRNISRWGDRGHLPAIVDNACSHGLKNNASHDPLRRNWYLCLSLPCLPTIIYPMDSHAGIRVVSRQHDKTIRVEHTRKKRLPEVHINNSSHRLLTDTELHTTFLSRRGRLGQSALDLKWSGGGPGEA